MAPCERNVHVLLHENMEKKKKEMKSGIIQKIKSISAHQKRMPKKSRFTEEERADVAVAWLKDEIGFRQIRIALKISGSNVYNFLASGCREALRQGKLTTPD